MNVSVAMATYNGEKYIEEQLKSIIFQLDADDEIIVSDDGSTDKTISIVEKLNMEWPKIKIVEGPRKGIVRNFMNAVAHCQNDIIILSDQDDIWCKSKVKKIKECFQKNEKIKVILHNAKLLKDNEELEARLLKYHKGFWRNLFKSSYWGCCMAIKRDFLITYFDRYSDGTAHDQIIGLLGEKKGVSHYMDEDLIYHRIHDKNKTAKLNIIQKFLFRKKVFRDFTKYYNKRKVK